MLVIPPEILVIPPEVLVLPPQMLVIPPEVLVFPPEVLVFPPEVLVFPPEMLVIPPEMLVIPPQTLVFPRDTLVIPPEMLVIPPQTLVIPPEVLVIPPQTLVIPPEMLVLPPQTLVIPPEVLVIPPETLVFPPSPAPGVRGSRGSPRLCSEAGPEGLSSEQPRAGRAALGPAEPPALLGISAADPLPSRTVGAELPCCPRGPGRGWACSCSLPGRKNHPEAPRMRRKLLELGCAWSPTPPSSAPLEPAALHGSRLALPFLGGFFLAFFSPLPLVLKVWFRHLTDLAVSWEFSSDQMDWPCQSCSSTELSRWPKSTNPSAPICVFLFGVFFGLFLNLSFLPPSAPAWFPSACVCTTG
ncbi:uncharacterized protein LOC131557430 isoform X2 [Ammospiza caudacuta]|uniref:uncharacterized protein LOC131557430 isoform X2 n=1 Tax=Ammospiza caudacuta TaxID=2857398 RepID=UPI002739ACA7|nr:uncharacterized protein LOC131557430 isoform X2 [Ammospiza caudacuta]